MLPSILTGRSDSVDIREFRNEILDEVHFNASINGTSPREEFLALYSGALVEAEELEDFEQLAYEGVGSRNTRILIDGYYYSELENCLIIVACPFSDGIEIQSLTATDAEVHFNRARAFVEESRSGFIQKYAEESSPGYGLAIDVQKRYANVTKYKFYLLTDMFVQLAQKIFVSWYLDRLYPFLRDKNVEPLSREESGEVWRKTKALVLHKGGHVARVQKDSLIISSFIAVAMSGIVDNYNLVINAVTNFVNIIFNSVISSFGNLIATETKERQYELFQVYRFFASWVYGFAVTGFFVLLTPLVRIWLGDAWVLPASAVALILIDLYFKGDRIVLSNYKTAAGVFEQDKYLALIQGGVNLVLSIWLVQKIGLAGIYVGTVISGLIANLTKPVIIYRVCFGRSSRSYFAESFRYAGTVAVLAAGLKLVGNRVMAQPAIGSFLLMVVIITLVFNGVFLLLFGRSREFRYLKQVALKKLGKV